MTLALIDYGAGNLHSVANALDAAGARDVVVTGDADVVASADRVVLPGVGAFAHCMAALTALPGMVEAMHEAVHARGRPFLGICVGMQLLADEGREHGTTPGLGWIGGHVSALSTAPGIKIPHMGWNDVHPALPHPVIDAGEAYYLHSYGFVAAAPGDVVALTAHGAPVVAAVARGTVIGVQFHPEKSQAYGLATLARFLEWAP
jgi:glutamine amidotransferase